jgi:hypothetical protein
MQLEKFNDRKIIKYISIQIISFIFLKELRRNSLNINGLLTFNYLISDEPYSRKSNQIVHSWLRIDFVFVNLIFQLDLCN